MLYSLRERLDEVVDIGIATGGINLFLGNLFDRLGSSEKDVEANGARIQRL